MDEQNTFLEFRPVALVRPHREPLEIQESFRTVPGPPWKPALFGYIPVQAPLTLDSALDHFVRPLGRTSQDPMLFTSHLQETDATQIVEPGFPGLVRAGFSVTPGLGRSFRAYGYYQCSGDRCAGFDNSSVIIRGLRNQELLI